MELGSRFINGEVVELMARLGMHKWRLSEDERFFLHRYVYLSILQGFRTLGIPVNEQDPLVSTNGILPRQVPELLRIPAIPEPVEDPTEAILVSVKETNGRH